MTLLTKAGKYVDQSQSRLSGDFEILRYSSIFSGLNLDVIKLFAYLSSHRRYQPGDYLIKQGQKAKQAFLLVKGSVEITVHHRDEEILLQKLEENVFFGELALLAQFKWFFNARAASELEVLIVEQTAFQKVIEKFPEHKDKLIERVIQLRVDRLTQQTSHMLDQLGHTGKQTSTAII